MRARRVSPLPGRPLRSPGKACWLESCSSGRTLTGSSRWSASAISAHPTTISLFFNVVFILLVVTLLNGGVARLWPRAAMNRGELLVVYAMLAVASCLPAHDLLQIQVPMLVWPYRFADASNRWAELFFRI